MHSFFQAIEDKDPKLGKESILALMDAVDNHIPTPERGLEEPFMLPGCIYTHHLDKLNSAVFTESPL